MTDRVEIQCGAAERDGKRAVVATLGSRQHVDKFDVSDSFRRSKFCDKVIAKFQLGEDAIEWLDTQIIDAAAAEDSAPAGGTPNVVCMADVPARKADWHWDGHVPYSGITIVDGEAGLSKSLWTVDMGARATRGDSPPPVSAPDGTFPRCNVLYLSPEDDPACTFRPRLDAARADMRRVFLLNSVNYCEGVEGREIKLPLDIVPIRRAIREHKTKLVFIDPLTAHLGDKINSNNDSSVREALMPLNRLAQEEHIAIVVIRHLAKQQGRSALNAGLGSVGIMATCRAGFLFAREQGSDRIIMACSKMNLARKPPSLAYRIVDHGSTCRIEWEGAVEITADELIDRGNKRGADKLETAKSIIEDVLSAGPRGSSEVEGAVNAAGISTRTFHDARKALGVKSEKNGFGHGGQWIMSLPMVANGYDHNF